MVATAMIVAAIGMTMAEATETIVIVAAVTGMIALSLRPA